jgi:hypothetical protein
MSMIHDAISRRMKKLGWTIHRLAKEVEGKVDRRTVYAFLQGEKDARTKTASFLLEALNLTITENPTPRGSDSKREPRRS